VKTRDQAGHESSVAVFSWTLDTIAPQTAITLAAPQRSGTQVQIAFASDDAASRFECNLDATGFKPCTSPQQYAALSSGPHTFTVRAIDSTGNRDASPATTAWRVNTPFEGFVTALYVDLLNRLPDASGLSHWVGKLEAGMTRAQVTATFWNSPEHRGLQVDRLYLAFLHQRPDLTSRAMWVKALRSGTTETDVAIRILGSDQYLAQRRSGGSWLDWLYEDVLGRPLDDGGRKYWERRSGAGVQTVARSLLASTEKRLQILDCLYEEYLDRPLDATGRSVWLRKLSNGQPLASVARAILNSDEYFTLAAKRIPASTVARRGGVL
jgi:hypothetical protein